MDGGVAGAAEGVKMLWRRLAPHNLEAGWATGLRLLGENNEM